MTTRRAAITAALTTTILTAAPAHAAPPRRVLFLGNSLTWNGTPDRTDVPTLVGKATGWAVTNAGRPRDTLTMMGARLQQQNLLPGHDTIVINGGTVEAQTCGLHGLTPVIRDLERIIDWCQARRVRVVVGSVVPLGRPPGVGRSLHAVSAALYTRQGDLARRRGLGFVDNYRALSDGYGQLRPDLFTLTYPGSTVRDEVHPDASGRALMATATVSALRGF